MDNLMGKAIYITWKELGVEFIHIADENRPVVFYITVPNDGEQIHMREPKAYGANLAQLFKTTMRKFQSDCIVKYKIRNEFWTKAKSEQSRNTTMRNIL